MITLDFTQWAALWYIGGVISGALGQGSVAVFSKIASIIIFTVLFVVLLMVALRLTVGALIEKHRERPKYEEEPEPERRSGRRRPLLPSRQKAPGPGLIFRWTIR